jgi:hypothetical protein
MRTLLLASLTISALQNPADACGPYVHEPTVFQLSSHYVRGAREQSRTFALLNEAPTGTPVWRALAPGTYDGAQIADASPLPAPMTLTLVGPSGTQLVASDNRSVIQGGLRSLQPTFALEVDTQRGAFVVALAGRHPNAKWIALDTQVQGSKADLDWVTAHGVTPYRGYGVGVYISKLQNTAYETVTVNTKEGATITFVRSGGTEIVRFDGYAMGGLSINGNSFVLKSDRHGGVTSMWI